MANPKQFDGIRKRTGRRSPHQLDLRGKQGFYEVQPSVHVIDLNETRKERRSYIAQVRRDLFLTDDFNAGD